MQSYLWQRHKVCLSLKCPQLCFKCLFFPSKNEPSPDTRCGRLNRGTRRTACGSGTLWPRPSRTARTTSSSSTTECPRRPARPSPTSPTTCVGRTATTSCTSTPRRTTLSCPYRTRLEESHWARFYAIFSPICCANNGSCDVLFVLRYDLLRMWPSGGKWSQRSTTDTSPSWILPSKWTLFTLLWFWALTPPGGHAAALRPRSCIRVDRECCARLCAQTPWLSFLSGSEWRGSPST